ARAADPGSRSPREGCRGRPWRIWFEAILAIATGAAGTRRQAGQPKFVRQRQGRERPAEAAAGIPARAPAREGGARTAQRGTAAQRPRWGDTRAGGIQPIGARDRGVEAGSLGLGLAAETTRSRTREVRSKRVGSTRAKAVGRPFQRRGE